MYVVVLHCFLLITKDSFTKIAVAAYPYSSGDNRMKKVSFCCVHIGRVWPGCSDASLLDTLVFDIDPPTSQDDEYGVNIEDAAALAGDMGMMEGNETEQQQQFPRLSKSGVPKMVIDFILANRKNDS